ncbi:MAG: THUMP domain-containing protein [Candidatus Thorarchaeota archaeon]
MRETSLRAFNLLVGCPREREKAAKSEVRYFIGDLLQDAELLISFTNVSGLITCWTSLDPFYVVHKLREFALENPYQFRFGVRFTPLEYCVESNLEVISRTARHLLGKIGENETFRVTVRRRQTNLENMEVVRAVAEEIPRKVNLDEPDKTIWVEIIGELTGVSVLNEERDILSITSMKEEIERREFNQ